MNPEQLRQDLKNFNLAIISPTAGVAYSTLSAFRSGHSSTISIENYIKVKNTLNKIAKDILGQNNEI